MRNRNYPTGVFNIVTAYIVGVIGYTLNDNSIFWGIIDALFYPIALIKWIVYEQLTLSLIKESFPFFFQ